MKNIDLTSFVGRDINILLKYADDLYQKDLGGKIHAHKIYSVILDKIPNIYASTNEHAFRGKLRKKIWDCEKYFFWNENYTSQSGQDKIIKNFFFNKKKKGYFIEIGAYDGIIGSNCYHFEKYLDWNGIAIEPSPNQFEKLKKNRKCKLLNQAISHEVKEVEFIEVIEGLTQMSGINDNHYKETLDIITNNKISKTKSYNLKTVTFDEIVPKNIDIDYISIDIEGGEMNLLNSINFNNYNIKVISVENNIPEKQNFKTFFEDKGFIYFDRVGQDEIFYNCNYFKFYK